MLGLGGESKTTENLLRTGECVLNLPSDSLAPAGLNLRAGLDAEGVCAAVLDCVLVVAGKRELA